MSKNLANAAQQTLASVSAIAAMTPDQEIAKLREDNARMAAALASKSQNVGRITVKIQTEPKMDKETGQMKPATFTVSVYGLGRFPVTLHGSQWTSLLSDDTVKAIKDACADPRVVAAGKAHDSK